jgi:hypothetical protein
MTKHYEPRKKKAAMPVRHTKIVVIDSRTSIEVLSSVPDDVARANYIEKVTRSPRSTYVPLQDKDEIPQEVLAAVIDDSELVEQD